MLNRWVHGDSNRTWSNYTRSIRTKNKSKLILQCNHVLSCVDKEDMSYHTSLNNLHLVGLLVSTALLLLSLVIFTIFPRSVFKVSYQGCRIAEVRFVNAVTAGSSVKLLPAV